MYAHAACLAPAVVMSDGYCKVCLAEYLPGAMCAVLRTSLMRHWTPKAHYCYAWALVRARRAAEALLQLTCIDHTALESEPGCVANCFVMEGRALLQLNRADEAVKAFERALTKVQPSQLVDVDVLVNAKVGLVYAHTELAKYKEAHREVTDASKLCELAAVSTVMKVYHANAALATARGRHFQAFAFLLGRHKMVLSSSRDCVFHAETLAESHLARLLIPAKKTLPPEDMRRLLKLIRRTGKKEVVQRAAHWLASQVRPARRLRGKRHPEVVEHRGRRVRFRKR